MPLADTRPQVSHVSRIYRRDKRREFARDHPDFADTARVLLALRPDFKRLKFRGASVSQQSRQRGIADITVDLESPDRSVCVRVWPTSAGLIADTVIDRPLQPWERRGEG